MDDLAHLEHYYQKYIGNLNEWLHEGIIDVNVALLQELDLLSYFSDESYDPALTRYFHVVETDEKITLVNSDFVIWIVPLQVNGTAVTYTLIALNSEEGPKLETAFSASGVYNSSKLVLRALEKFLMEIQENEAMMESIKKTGS